ALSISDRPWRSEFGSRPDIVGLPVELNAIKRPIVGVRPPDVLGPLAVDVYLPLRFSTENDPDLRRRDNFVFQAIARLAPGATVQTTRASMSRLARLAEITNPEIRKNVSTMPMPLLELALGPTTPKALWILLGAVRVLLLIGWLHVVRLLFGRHAT